jgi:SAM-dependent methyltransferase
MSVLSIPATGQRVVLHVGCGEFHPEKLHPMFRGPQWREVRLDIDPNMQPDIVGSITDMSMIASETVDGVFSSHNLEHLYSHEVPQSLREFLRVLKPGGLALITLPDLQFVAGLVAADQLEETAYVSPAGPIAALDMIYGHRYSVAHGNTFMAHRTGFTGRSLANHLRRAGFAAVRVHRSRFDLWALARKQP